MTTITIQPLVATNNPATTGITVTNNPDGSKDILLTWTYAQSSVVPADGLMLFFHAGTLALSNADPSITLSVGATSHFFQGVPQDFTGRVGIASYRNTATGIKIGPIQQPTSSPDWRTTGTAVNIGDIPVTDISAIFADNIIDRAEKKRIRKDWDAGVLDWAALDAQAATYSITTTRTNLTAALQDLGDYLNSGHGAWALGTVPFHINDSNLNIPSNVDAVIRSTLTTKATAYLAARTALQNAITNAAATKAVWTGVTGTGKPADNATVGAPTGTYVAGVLAEAVVEDADAGKITYDATIDIRQIAAPTNAPTYPTYAESPTPIQISAQSAGGVVDVTVNFTYTQAASPNLLADGFALFRYTGAFSFTSAIEVSTSNSPLTRAMVHNAVPIDTGYNYAVAAFRRTVGTGEDSKIFSTVATGWVKEAGVANVGLVATETADFRIVQVATNNPTVPTPTSIEAKTSGSYAGVDVHLYWDYTQGTLKADLIGFEIWDPATLTYRPIGVNVTPSQGRAVFQGLVAGREYKFALHTIRNTSGGPQLGSRVTGWDITPADALGITGKVNGETAATIATSTQFITAFTADNKLTYKEKLALRDNLWASITGEYSDLVAQGTAASVSTTAYTNAYTTLNTYFNVTTRTMTSSGVGGSTTLFHTASMAYTHDIPDGVALRGYVATYYTAKEALKNALRDKITTTANNATSTANTASASVANKLDATTANILSGSVALKTSGYDSGNGLAITANGITAKKNGSNTLAIASDGTATFSGNISGGAGIDISGNAVFQGSSYNSVANGYAAISAMGQSGQSGIIATGGAGYSAIVAYGNSGTGVTGNSNHPSYYGVVAQNSGGGTGLYVYGAMQISSSALVSNLNANYLNSLSTGNSSGQIPVSNGTTCTNLNANYLQGYPASSFRLASSSVPAGDISGAVNATYLQGYAPGNGGSSIPLSNGVMNTNLNAQYINGYPRDYLLSSMYTTNGTYASWSAGWAGLYMGSGLSGSQRTWASGNAVYIDTISDERHKKDIKPEQLGLDFINKLEPVTYRMKQGKPVLHHGFIAQKMAKHFEGANIDALYTEAEDGVLGVGYANVIAPLVKAVQEMYAEIEQLKSQLKELKNG